MTIYSAIELELLQEARFHPLEVFQSATMNGAMTLHEPKGTPIEFGVVRKGLRADMVIVDQNPLENLKVRPAFPVWSFSFTAPVP